MEPQARPPDFASEAPATWEIFKHAWPVVWENPPRLFLFVFLPLAAAGTVIDLAGDALLAPYMSSFLDFWTKTDAEKRLAVEALGRSVAEFGRGRFAAGLLLSWLATPLTLLAQIRAALRLWDGFDVSADELKFAVRRYPEALKVSLLVSVFGLFLCLFGSLAFWPFLILKSLFAGASLHVRSLVGLLGTAMGAYFLIKVFWPHLRRFAMLEATAFLQLVDGAAGPWIARLAALYRHLHRFPAHLNQGALILAACALGWVVVFSVFAGLMDVLPAPEPADLFLGRTLYFVALMWPLTGLAGLYRLVLFPPDDEAPGGLAEPDAAEPQGAEPQGPRVP
ncbi:MAG: hypothetical protein LBU12_01885 [Deltaproteobacteria bacterium]|jgi:hypothetical protein|nr:hypothetical protein [Deltaproteobacteria bacterium]